MRIKKIIYFIESPFCQRDFERFGIDIIKDNGFCVETWDFTPFISPETHDAIKVPDPIDYRRSNCRLFMNEAEVIKEIKKLKQDIMVIPIMFFDYEHYFLYRELSKQNIPYAFIITNTIPIYKNDSSGNYFINKYRPANFIKKLKKFNLEKLKKRIFNKIPNTLLMIRFPKFIFAGGYRSLIDYKFPIGKETKIVWCHTLDYDLYLKDLRRSSSTKLIDGDYIVFCDEYFPFHPEYIRRNIKHFITPEAYYGTICKFFDEVEKETGFKVVVAAHPRSKYEEHPDYFDGRKVISGKTMELVKNSKFVLMHASTSFNFAVLYYKPVLFLTMDKIEQAGKYGDYIRMFSSELEKRSINIDRNRKIDWDKELRIDEEAYANYKENYIKRKNSTEDFFWQIVADEIKRL